MSRMEECHNCAGQGYGVSKNPTSRANGDAGLLARCGIAQPKSGV